MARLSDTFPLPRIAPQISPATLICASFLYLAAVISLLTALCLYSLAQVHRNDSYHGQAHEKLRVLQNLLLAATTAETASLNYAASGQASYLREYQAAALQIDPMLTRLADSQQDGDLQLPPQHVAALAGLIAQQRQAQRQRLLAAPAKIAAPLPERGEDAALYRLIAGIGDDLAQVPPLSASQRWLHDPERHAYLALLGLLLLLPAAALTHTHWQQWKKHADAFEKGRNSQLQAEEQMHLLQTIINRLQEGIVVTTPDCRIISVNPAFTVITEYAPEEVIGKHIRILQSGRQDAAFYRKLWEDITIQGCWQGEIWDRRRSGDVHQVWLNISTLFCSDIRPRYYLGILTDLSRMQRAKTHLEHLAHHDPLTGLPNRLFLHSRLTHAVERAKRNYTWSAVLFLDLDNFKPVNDRLGHAAGDELLQQVAARLRGRLRDIDTLARIGGDEFVIVLEDIVSQHNAIEVASSVIELLSSPFEIAQDHNIDIGASIGIAFYPRDGERPESLLEAADMALYAAKQAGKGQWSLAPTGLGRYSGGKPPNAPSRWYSDPVS